MALCVCVHARSVLNTLFSHCARTRRRRGNGADPSLSPAPFYDARSPSGVEISFEEDGEALVCLEGILNASCVESIPRTLSPPSDDTIFTCAEIEDEVDDDDDDGGGVLFGIPSSPPRSSVDDDGFDDPSIFASCRTLHCVQLQYEAPISSACFVVPGAVHPVTHLRTTRGVARAKNRAAAAMARGRTRLHAACASGQLDLVLCLLDHGASADTPDEDGGVTPLHLASQSGGVEVVDALLSRGATVDPRTREGGETPLILAASVGDATCVERLLLAGADVRLSRSHNFLALHEAASRGHADIVRLLLDAGNDVNAAPNSGWTALHAAAYYGYPDVVDLLISRGADVGRVTADGVPPLHLAVGRGSKGLVEIVRSIIETGKCDLDFADKGGNTALHKAIYESRKEILKYLINCGSNLNRKNLNGYTPFRRAADRLCIDTCQLLVEAGCDLSLEAEWIDSEQFPVSMARRRGTIAWLKAVVKGLPGGRPFPSLQIQCRRVVRLSVCRWDVHGRVEALPIPNKLKRFVLLH